ncbi:MAG: metal ABC transporter ATP-binding protein [Lachnospiraceae bacterium]|nr:metal ABC transporter ATP-binding protein [Lachnospiraceae bacterium]
MSVQNLTLGYEKEVVIRNLNFAVNAGNYLCIVGENGSGKSTLVKALLGLLAPMSGYIIFDEDLSRSEIGYLPQQTEIQRDFPASVREVVLSGFQGRMGMRPFYTAAEKKEALEQMERMGILEFAKRCYRDLSGGQQQRVLLARALCATKKLLLLDEPVTGLDPKVTQELYDLIETLHKEGVTIVMISHDVEAAVKYATHILHIGDITFFGSKKDYLNSQPGRRFLAGTKREK